MKNLNFVFTLLIATVFMFASCQKEKMESLDTTVNESQAITNDSDDPVHLKISEDLILDEKGTAIGQRSFEENKALIQQAADEYTKQNTNKRGATSRSGEAGATVANSSSTLRISCGQTKYGRNDYFRKSLYDRHTYSGCDHFNSSFNGDDVEYLLTVDRESNVEITMDNLHADLDIFLFTNNGGLGHCLASSTGPYTNSEKITMRLQAGSYWILIDGYDRHQVSDFRLKVKCTPLHNRCEREDDFERYRSGEQISRANPHNWVKYDPHAALDGIVATKSYAGRQSLKLAWNNHYDSSDQPRDLFKLGTRHSGTYSLTFKMFVGHGNNAKIALHKYDRPRNTAIEFFFRKAGGIAVRSKDRVDYLPTHYNQERWIAVEILIDLHSRTGTLTLDGRNVYQWNTASYAYDAHAQQNTIGGIQFAAYDRSSKFYVDDICFSERGGYNGGLASNN